MRPRTGILIILDGFGVNPKREHNAIAQAKMPTFDRLLKEYPHGTIDASEHHVGLPNGFMGNSEVGHLNIGAGRIVYQDFSLISHAIETGEFFKNPVLIDLMEGVAKDPEATLHCIGLLSDGGVHSHISHLMALLQMAKQKQISKVAIHVITDGRDTAPTSGISFVKRLQGFCHDLGVGTIATVMGRFYAMDRDKRWERVRLAYEALVEGNRSKQRERISFSDPCAYLQEQYEKAVTDEFVVPAYAKGYRGVGVGDGICFFNFRADRARQLTKALTQKEFTEFSRHEIPTLSAFASLTCYDEALAVPNAFDRKEIKHSLGELVSRQGWKQLRIAETEKYAHVTYFFNGGKESPFEGETRILIPSPKEVRTYDEKPEMSAKELTDRLLKELDSGNFSFVVVNFANPDMVGHTGNLPAAVRALETVDACLAKILEWVEGHSSFAILTADHGNCEMMQDVNGTPLTAHTTLPVPLIIIDPKQKEGLKIRSGGALCDIAPTLLTLWGLEKPAEMTGNSLV